ncbi:minor capsid protein [Candidatus Contubernalis alkaliaceticus]|uniref:minor capsid protein n=1 Tax=Candidatus Contubernalis alkaliaceticus TaxID=338645 RepID=UPI001F4BF92E|nr:minor capsid protein [Candidatus Contubernalis alkalaceticus]UNC92711.1 hypothetical protein HUE98_11760 [Candidatus Contubernalis alkalaceticus]
MIDDITQKIESEIAELTENVNLFKNYYPDDPDTIVSVIASGGFPPDRYDVTREPTIEIKIRASDYNEGMSLGNQIYDLFHSRENYQLGSFFILSSYAYSDLSYLYSDKQNRDEFSLELAFLVKRV